MKIINGDILESNCNIICHQVNCRGVMGKGLAKQIKYKYPNVYNKYVSYCNQNNILGTVLYVYIGNGQYIANLFGQNDYGMNTRKTDYNALGKCFQTIANHAREKHLSVAIPYNIGCCLGGGDWKIVSSLIEKHFLNVDVTIVKLGC